MLDRDSYLDQFDPIRDDYGRVCEPADVYAERMQAGLLSNWPTEVLVEWFHHHAGNIELYAPLKFERMQFRRETWPDERVPGREAFFDPTFCDDPSDVLSRAHARNDWLANYMAEHGTWNIPIVLLESETSLSIREDLQTRTPLHLLEGHKRLSYLEGLRELGRAASEHVLWIVNLDP
jgi:hypothetical protein